MGSWGRPFCYEPGFSEGATPATLYIQSVCNIQTVCMSTPKAAQSQSTRAELVAVARKLFAERGYAGTSTEEIVRTAGMTRGALYHQFKDKKGLFRAVAETVESELGPMIAANATPGADAWTFLVAAC